MNVETSNGIKIEDCSLSSPEMSIRNGKVHTKIEVIKNGVTVHTEYFAFDYTEGNLIKIATDKAKEILKAS